jgi:hypothetical protein
MARMINGIASASNGLNGRPANLQPCSLAVPCRVETRCFGNGAQEMSAMSAAKQLVVPAARTPCADLGCSRVNQAWLFRLEPTNQEAAINSTGNSFDSAGDPQRAR